MAAATPNADNTLGLQPCAPGTLAFKAANALAFVVAQFRPLQSLTETEYRRAPNGSEVETRVKVPAVFVDQMCNPSWAVIGAWVERDAVEACLNVRLMGYWIEIYFIHKNARR